MHKDPTAKISSIKYPTEKKKHTEYYPTGQNIRQNRAGRSHALVRDELHIVLPLQAGVAAPPHLQHSAPPVLHRGPHQRDGCKGRHVREGYQDVQLAHLAK